MKPEKHVKLYKKAEDCTSRKEARKILKKARKDELLTDTEYNNYKSE